MPLLVALWAGPLAGQSAAQTFNADPATLGAIPDATGECGTNGAPLFVVVPVTGMVGGVTSVSVSMVLSHTWMGEITATLIAPDGTQHLIFGRTLANEPMGFGSEKDLNGATYTFNDGAAGNWWAAATLEPVPGGSYRTSTIGGFPGANGAVTSMNPVFANREPNGNWLMRLTDSCKLDFGFITGMSLTLTSTGIIGPPVAAVPDSYFVGRSTPLVIGAPGVLANDINAPGSGALTATLETPPVHGAVTLDSNGGFRYTPVAGYLGADSFTYYPSNLGGSAPSTTVSLTVVPVQPPTNFRVDRVVGSLVTLRWDPPSFGPAVSGYFVQGGTTPGSADGAVATGPAAAVTFAAPSGAFYVRVRALDGAMFSDPSNEVRLFVNVPVAPSAPVALTGLVNGDGLTLSWKQTHEGGEPTAVAVDVTGTLNTTVPLGRTESFSFTGVPAGTYTFSVRAGNGAGVSTSSNPVTLTFPGECSGVPLAPRNYLFYSAGNTVFLLWDPPSTGPAPLAYVLNVNGAYVGALPVGTSRNIVQAVPSGSYSVSVTAYNACGASAPTAVQTVQVP